MLSAYNYLHGRWPVACLRAHTHVALTDGFSLGWHITKGPPLLLPSGKPKQLAIHSLNTHCRTPVCFSAGETSMNKSWGLDSGNSEVGRQTHKGAVITHGARCRGGDVRIQGTGGAPRRGTPWMPRRRVRHPGEEDLIRF